MNHTAAPATRPSLCVGLADRIRCLARRIGKLVRVAHSESVPF
jgi:hypothetical protein